MMFKIRKLLSILLAVCLMTGMSPVGMSTALATTPVGSAEVVVAVIDTGVDYTHKDLAGKMKLENGKVRGYNAITKQESGFMDDSADSHGTMAAGIIASEIEKGKGIAGTVGGSNVKIMPIKALDGNGNAKIDDVADAVNWAVDNGAHVINISVGEWLTQDNYPASLSDAIAYAHKKGVLVVAAAGNSGENIKQEEKAYYPAVLPEILSVGSTGPDMQPSKFSNTGAKVYAPGEDVYSTQIGDTYGYADGTSLAAAQVSGEEAIRLFSVKAASLSEAASGEGVYATDEVSGQSGGGSIAPTVIGITVASQPKLVYTAGDNLDLIELDESGNVTGGLKATLHYSDESYIGPIDYYDFESMGITTDPAQGTKLTTSHNGQKIKVSCNGYDAYTDNLTVTDTPLEGADFWPESTDFNKDLAYQLDVEVEIKWWHSTLSIADVKNGETSVGPESYNLSKNSENKDILTIKKEYLATQPVGGLTLTVEFTEGSSAQLTINIWDTAPAWPKDSTLTARNVTQDSVYLSWTIAQNTMSYKIYQDDKLIHTTMQTADTFEVTGLSPSTTYKFQIQAGDGFDKWTSDGPTLTVSTLSTPGSNPPTWPEGSALTVSNVTHDTANLSWSPAQDDVAVASYNIYQDGVLIQTAVTVNSFEVSSLLPATAYDFQIQAGDADGQWTTDGPAVSVTTKSLTAPEILELKLNAPRKNIRGSLYMGDTTKIELISTETGLHPEVTINYGERKSDPENSDREIIEQKSCTVTLAETSFGSKKYTADFILSEGIWMITSLKGVLSESIAKTVVINSRVAGRLKATVQPPTGLSPEQVETYNQLLASSFAIMGSAQGGGSFKGQFKDGTIIIEGVEEAGDYTLWHYNANYQLISQRSSINIKGGLESVLNYEIGTPSHVKVRVVDDATGQPVQSIMVIGKTTHVSGIESNRCAFTDIEGYAVSETPYFIKNALKGSQIKFTTANYSIKNDGSDWYEDGSLETEIASMGDNEFEIRIKKVKMVTVTGTVKNSSGVPVEGAYVYLGKAIYKDGRIMVSINLHSETDANGVYTMQVAKVPEEIEAAIYVKDLEIKKTLKLEEEVNTLNIDLPPYKTPTIKVTVETKDLSGNIGKIVMTDVFGTNMARRAYINIVNKTTGETRWDIGDAGMYNISGKPGDTVEVLADGLLFGLGKGSATAVINDGNYAEVSVLLIEKGSIRANLTDQNGDRRIGDKRYMYLFEADNGQCIGRVESSAPYISHSLPEGTYNIVLSWDGNGGYSYLNWTNDQNCIIVENLQVKDGEVIDLGTKELNYFKPDLCFKYNMISGFTSNSTAALPGNVITLRVAYDFEKPQHTYIDPGKLDLVAQIPLGTTYVENSAIHRMTRGNREATEYRLEDGSVILDLKESIEGAAGTLTYQVSVNNPVAHDKIRARAELRFDAGQELRSEVFGTFEIPTKMITLNSPLDIGKAVMANPVEFSGLAPANNIVELYDGNIKIGEAKATRTGQWNANLLLPDMGAPVFHHITAKTVADKVEYSDKALILVGVEGVHMTEFTLSQGSRTIKIDLSKGGAIFPFTLGSGDFLASISFSDNDKVRNVKIQGCTATRQGNEFRAHIPYSMCTSSEILVDYQEDLLVPEDIYQYIPDVPPPSLAEAEAEFADEGTTVKDVNIEYGTDGYIKALDIPEFRLTTEEGSITTGMTMVPVTFDPAKAINRTNLGNGLYGYDFSYELIDGKHVITAYLDRRLLSQPDDYQANRQTTLRAASAGLEAVKTVLEVAGDGNDLMGAYGDLSASAKMLKLMGKFESVRPNLEPHMVEYYDRQIELMGKDILMGKTLGLVGEGVGKAGNLVPLLGQVVVEVAGLVSGKLLGDMFDNEFEADYGRLMANLSNEPGGEEKPDDGSYEEDPYGDYHPEPLDPYWYWYWYVYHREWMDDTDYDRDRRKPIKPYWIFDPSGFVYEAVEDNRIEGVTATALYLPKDAAADSASAKTSDKWQFWDAEWFLQINPQQTDAEGKYAWDVPEGWWMVQYVKDGFQTAYSDALPVPPPQLEVNIPMVKLEQPAVEKTVWGSGGRYVDVYFSKHMDIRSLEEANSVSIADDGGITVTVTIEYPVPVKAGANELSLTKVVRYVTDAPLISGKQYTLTVNKAVADYAGFSMTDDYTEIETVPDGALIKSFTGSEIKVEPGKDITQDIMDALTVTSVNPGDEVMLDKRMVLVSSNSNVVRIWDDGKVASLGEGTAEITATAMDDTSKKAVFTVTVAYPPANIRISRMVILDKNGGVLTDLIIQRGSAYKLIPNISPANAGDKSMLYSSDNPAVASVDQNGRIQAISEGIAVITARTVDQNIRQKIFVTVKPPGQSGSDDDDSGGGSGSNNGGGGRSTTPPANTTIVTPEQINGHESFELQFEGLKIGIDPKDLPTPPKDGSSISVRSSHITDPDVLKTFFLKYPNRQGIMKGYSVTFTRENNGRTENITELKGEITLAFQLTSEELTGIDPGTLMVYKQAEDGSITEYSGEFDSASDSLQISTSHLCKFFIMGEKGISTQRLAGYDRYGTAVAISAQGWLTSDYVILASGEVYPDALAGSVLAGLHDAPILLTERDSLNEETLKEIERLRAKKILIMGGSAVISESIVLSLKENYTVERVYGIDRYETAVAAGNMARQVKATDTAIIATGLNFPDAMSIAPFAAIEGTPVLYTPKDSLDSDTEKALKDWGIKKVIITGCTGVISAEVEDHIRNVMNIQVVRLGGYDKYLTSIEIAKYYDQGYDYQGAVVATGDVFADALSGASFAARKGCPVLLVPGKILENTLKYIDSLKISKYYILGGPGAVAE